MRNKLLAVFTGSTYFERLECRLRVMTIVEQPPRVGRKVGVNVAQPQRGASCPLPQPR